MPTLDSFTRFVENLEPKAKDMISWNGKYNKETDCHFARSKILDFTIANQLLAVLVRLRLALPVTDISVQFGMAEST